MLDGNIAGLGRRPSCSLRLAEPRAQISSGVQRMAGSESTVRIPLRHLSVRVPWHEAGWDGTISVCWANPEYEEKWAAKLNWYRENGIIPEVEGGGENGTLVRSAETKGIDNGQIARLIRKINGGA